MINDPSAKSEVSFETPGSKPYRASIESYNFSSEANTKDVQSDVAY